MESQRTTQWALAFSRPCARPYGQTHQNVIECFLQRELQERTDSHGWKGQDLRPLQGLSQDGKETPVSDKEGDHTARGHRAGDRRGRAIVQSALQRRLAQARRWRPADGEPGDQPAGDAVVRRGHEVLQGRRGRPDRRLYAPGQRGHDRTHAELFLYAGRFRVAH